MEQEKVVTFNADLSKNHEFIGRLKAILNRDDSSIAFCYITMTADQRYTVIIEPFDASNGDYLTFGFHAYDLPFRERSTKPFSDSDIIALNDLFSEFALTNRYEGLFFASKFFTPEYRHKPLSVLVLKYTFDENRNRLVVNDKKVSKHYSLVPQTALLGSISSLNKDLDDKSDFFKCDINLLMQRNYNSLKDAMSDYNKFAIGPLIVEYYKDFETYDCFVGVGYELIDSTLTVVDIKYLLEKS